MLQISINKPKTKRSGQAIHSVGVWMWSEPKTSLRFFDSTADSDRKKERAVTCATDKQHARNRSTSVCLVGVGHAHQCVSLCVKYEETLEVNI